MALNALPELSALAAAPGRASQYATRLASSSHDLQAAQALRFEVFNLELNEGLVQAFDSGLDSDAFDAICAHLIVEDTTSGQIVGTYRLQTGTRAAEGLGYYSQREFDFSPFEAWRHQILELGRACVHQHHRNFAVLNLLWKGIGVYAQQHGARYLLGCSSLTSQDPAVGWTAYRQLAPHLAPAAWQTGTRPGFECPKMPAPAPAPAPKIPRLLSAYLTMGAAICSPPAIDREFRTIDFLTWLDIQSPKVLAMQQRGRFIV